MTTEGESADARCEERPRRVTAQGRTFGRQSIAPSLLELEESRRSSGVGSLVEIVEEALETAGRRITGARRRVSETS